MFGVRKLLPLAFQPTPLMRQVRGVRPKIKISKDTFEVLVSVRQYALNEVKVKVREGFVTVEGSQERKTKDGFIIRRFEKKFKLPKDCPQDKIKCTLSKDGVLKLSAQRCPCDMNLPCERYVKIEREREKASARPPDEAPPPESKNPCDAYFKK